MEAHTTLATPVQRLIEIGQSPWYDNIRRGDIASGALQALIDRGIRGVTVNPSIFEKAIRGSTDYDEAIRDLLARDASATDVYERLLIADIAAAADVLRPLYDQTTGQDGYVSIEIAPTLAHDTAASIAEARRFWHALHRPNVMVKIPATPAGIPAIRRLIGEGINVNITLIFGLESYDRVMEAYLAGLEQAAADGRPLDRIASVASFFVSRVDSAVDKRLGALIKAEQDEARRAALAGFLGTAAIAHARIAYQHFLTTFGSARFKALKAQGAHVQRPLWASTGTKNAAYRDVRYVEELIGPDTVTTMPPATITAFEDHGRVERTIDRDVEAADATLGRLNQVGIKMKDVADTLQADSIMLFIEALESLNRAIEDKRLALLADRAEQPAHTPARV